MMNRVNVPSNVESGSKPRLPILLLAAHVVCCVVGLFEISNGVTNDPITGINAKVRSNVFFRLAGRDKAVVTMKRDESPLARESFVEAKKLNVIFRLVRFDKAVVTEKRDESPFARESFAEAKKLNVIFCLACFNKAVVTEKRDESPFARESFAEAKKLNVIFRLAGQDKAVKIDLRLFNFLLLQLAVAAIMMLIARFIAVPRALALRALSSDLPALHNFSVVTEARDVSRARTAQKIAEKKRRILADFVENITKKKILIKCKTVQ